MRIETDSEEVSRLRALSLELLLSDHRADCEAPCTLVCTQGLDVERMLYLYECGNVMGKPFVVGGCIPHCLR